jgi:type III pantothenate kinase
MNLVIDIGNTCSKIAIFNQKDLVKIVYDSNESLEKLKDLYQEFSCKKGIIASVIELNATIHSQLNALPIDWFFLNHNTPLPITNSYKSPTTLGYDRIAAVVGANEIFPSQNLLVIDAGTAITYDFLNDKNEYLGGNISPGINMRFKALHNFTNQLPLIDKEGEIPLWGYDTTTAIRSGVVQGVKFEITENIRLFKEKYANLLVFLTGGEQIPFDCNIKNSIFADSFLLLKGLNRILNYNDSI